MLRHLDSGDYVVAHEGTESDANKIRDVAFTDAQMALLKINQKLDDARTMVELASKYAKRYNSQVTVTGHAFCHLKMTRLH